MRCLAQGHLDTQLGGSGDRTSSLVVTSQPDLSPEAPPEWFIKPFFKELQPLKEKVDVCLSFDDNMNPFPSFKNQGVRTITSTFVVENNSANALPKSHHHGHISSVTVAVVGATSFLKVHCVELSEV